MNNNEINNNNNNNENNEHSDSLSSSPPSSSRRPPLPNKNIINISNSNRNKNINSPNNDTSQNISAKSNESVLDDEIFNAANKAFTNSLSDLLKNQKEMPYIGEESFVHGFIYNKYCKHCVNKITQAIILKLKLNEDEEKNINNSSIMKKAIEKYLQSINLGIVERIEEETVSNEMQSKLSSKPLSSLRLSRCVHLADNLKNREILKLTNLSKHLLHKGSRRGVVFEICNPDDDITYIINSNMSFDEALIKSVPENLTCSCTSEQFIDDYNRDGRQFEDWHISPSWDSESNSTFGANGSKKCDNKEDLKDEPIDNEATFAEKDKEYSSDHKEENEKTFLIEKNLSYCEEDDTIKLVGLSEKHICMKLCEHKNDCPLDSNNKKIIGRNINVDIEYSPTKEITNVEIGNRIESPVNSTNMMFLLGSTTYRNELFKNDIDRQENYKLRELVTSMNKDQTRSRKEIIKDVKHIVDLCNDVKIASTGCIVTCLTSIFQKVFTDNAYEEFNENYHRRVTTLPLGSVSRGDMRDNVREFLSDYVYNSIDQNVKCFNNKLPYNIEDVKHYRHMYMVYPPLCGGKNDYGTKNIYYKMSSIVNPFLIGSTQNSKVLFDKTRDHVQKQLEMLSNISNDYSYLYYEDFKKRYNKNKQPNANNQRFVEISTLSLNSKYLYECSLRKLEDIGRILYDTDKKMGKNDNN
nr:MAG: hypothetical protein [Metapenaeopsis lamellata majanivirus]